MADKNKFPRRVVLDASGKPVLPAPLASQFEAERREQYVLDRHEAIMSLDPAMWRTFALRWGMAPPPDAEGGWTNHELIIDTMHTIRIVVESIPYEAKHISAMHLLAKGRPLPPGVYIEDGVLHGARIAK
jgi:hypothetical protein